MDKSRSSNKHNKKRPKKSSKKSKRHRRSPYLDEDSKYNNMRSTREPQQNYKIVEYSDVSSEDFSAPEAGEIQDEENSLSLSDREITTTNNGNCNDRLVGSSSTISAGLKTDSEHILDRIGGSGSNANVSTTGITSNSIITIENLKANISTTPLERKIIVGSPISSSVSSNSRSKLRHSPSPLEFSERRLHLAKDIRKDSISSPLDDDNDDLDDDDDDNAGKSDESEIERKRKKSKKSKKKKSKKKRKKKRNKSISSIENISDNDSVLDDDINNLTPPLRAVTPTQWEKRYTPARPNSLSKSPMTPPLRPNSNMSIYSETSRRTPPLSQKYNTSSPHTPPLVPRKITSTAYHSSPIDVDVNSSGSHSHSHSHFHHSSHHSYHHQPRSPITLIGKELSISSSSRRSKSPSKQNIFFYVVCQMSISILKIV